MNDERGPEFAIMPSGVPNLDTVLGGGIPVGSFNLIAGGPGVGKTILSQQIMFANAAPDRVAIYFTVLGEPTLKLLRFQQQYTFFDSKKVGKSIHFINLSDTVRRLGLKRTLDALNGHVAKHVPGLVVVDSFRTLLISSAGETARDLQSFLHDLSVQLTGWQTTSILVGEYGREELVGNPAFTVADGILWLTQQVERNSVVRKVQVIKMRGQAPMSGLHTFRISEEGLHVFPRFPQVAIPEPVEARVKRLSIGIAGLNEMMGGGLPEGETVLVAGPSGTGKTIATFQFLIEGVRQGEPGVMVTFEESPEEHIRKAVSFGWDLRKMVEHDLLELIYLRPVDLTVEEVLERLEHAVARIDAKRVVINSISGFELAIAPSEREDFREALYRFTRGLVGRRIALMMTSETPGIFAEPYPTFYRISFLTDNIVLFRFVEIESRLELALAVVKMRTSSHSRDLQEYAITERGIEVGAPFVDYAGVLTGIPTPVLPTEMLARRLFDEERAVLQVLMEYGEETAAQVAHHGNLDERLVERLLQGLSRRSLVAQVVEPDRVTYHAILPEPRAQRARPKRPESYSM